MVLGTEGGLPAEQGLLGSTRVYLSHVLLFLFLRYSALDWAKVGRKDCVCVCVCVCVGILMETLSHYSKVCITFE